MEEKDWPLFILLYQSRTMESVFLSLLAAGRILRLDVSSSSARHDVSWVVCDWPCPGSMTALPLVESFIEKMNTEMEKLDIDSIFTKYSINEIRDIEEKIKVDMEKKKEELRSMVG